MFHLGVITDEISQDFRVALDLAEQSGLDGVEIRSVWGKNPFELTVEEAKQIYRLTRERGLSICGISSPFFKCSLQSPEEIQLHMAGLERCLGLAERWEAPIIRGFPFWRKQPLETVLPRIAEVYQKPAELSRRRGATLTLESDPSVSAGNGRELSQVVDVIASPWVKALWDPGNDLYSPVPEIPYPAGYQCLKGKIAHVHLKDARLDVSGRIKGCCFGEGLVDWRGQLSALARDGYTGWVVMETHYRLNAVLSDEALKLPGGSAFSAGGLEPTRQCLESLRAMLRELGLDKNSV